MSKYTSPGVTLQDVAACLPQVDLPLLMRVVLYPAAKNSTRFVPAVELVLVLPNGDTRIFRRWGAEGKGYGPQQTLSRLLVAAQTAYNYVEGCDKKELLKLVQWQLDLPVQG